MSKLNSHTDQIILKVVKELQGADLKVFLAWYTDSTKFNASQSEISVRTGHGPSTVSKAFSSLIQKGILEEVQRVKRSVDYKMTDLFLKSISVPVSMPAAAPLSKSILSDPEDKVDTTPEGKVDGLNKFDKIYLLWKRENKQRLSVECTRKLVGILISNKITETELEDFGKKFKKDTKESIEKAGRKMASDKRASWVGQLEESFDSASVEFFSGDISMDAEDSYVPPEDLNARKAGFYSKKQMEDYLSAIPHVDMEALAETERIRNENLANLNLDLDVEL